MAHNGVAGRASWASFAAWAAVGTGLSLGVLTVHSVGTVLLTASVLCAAALAVRGGLGAPVSGLLEGFALPVLYVAFANIDGPGWVCSTTGSACFHKLSPWPWMTAGMVSLGVGVGLFLRRRRL